MKKFNHWLLLAVALLGVLTACDDDKSYADRLNTERNACNAYLANHRVINGVPADTVFETGEDAPFYRLDNEGNVYMQVLRAGNRAADKAKTGETIYFRYKRYSVEAWFSDGTWIPQSDANLDDMSIPPFSFRYADYTNQSSYQWGYGIQYPLNYLGVECEVNLLVKSQYGLSNEISYVMPYLYHVRYYHSQI